MSVNMLRLPVRWGLIALVAVLFSVLLTGCTGSLTPPTEESMQALGQEMARLETLSAANLARELPPLIEVARTSDQEKEGAAKQARAYFLQGYIAELQQAQGALSLTQRDYAPAQTAYERATKAGSGFAAMAHYRLGVLASANLLGTPDESHKLAKEHLQRLSMVPDHTKVNANFLGFGGQSLPVYIVVRTPEIAGEGGAAAFDPAVVTTPPAGAGPLLHLAPPTQTARRMLDAIYQSRGGIDQFYYRAVSAFVGFFKQHFPTFGIPLALFLIALIVKLITLPLTNASFRSMRAMQKLQPLLKALQEKYQGDKAKQSEEMMKLYKEHNANPAGSCLPMLIQIPVFLIVWQAVNVYAYGFAQSGFLWIPSLAEPDSILLWLYAASMVVTSLLTATPATDSQQKAMQMQMTVLMPIMFLVLLHNVASAFILYWFFLNVLSSLHQYAMIQYFNRIEAEQAAAAATTAAAPPTTPRKKGKRS